MFSCKSTPSAEPWQSKEKKYLIPSFKSIFTHSPSKPAKVPAQQNCFKLE